MNINTSLFIAMDLILLHVEGRLPPNTYSEALIPVDLILGKVTHRTLSQDGDTTTLVAVDPTALHHKAAPRVDDDTSAAISDNGVSDLCGGAPVDQHTTEATKETTATDLHVTRVHRDGIMIVFGILNLDCDVDQSRLHLR